MLTEGNGEFMNKQDLAKLGIEDEELVQKIIVLHGKDIERLKSELDAKAGEIEQLNNQLAEAGKAIEGFKEMDIDGIKKAAEEWKSKAEQAKLEADQKVQELKLEHALKDALVAAKAKNPKVVKALLEMDKIKFSEDGNSLEGLDEQLETIKQENDYLFDIPAPVEETEEEEEEPEPKIVARTENKGILGDAAVSAARKAAGLPYN